MDEKKLQKVNTIVSAVFIVAAAVLLVAAIRHRSAGQTTGTADTASTGTPETSGMQTYEDLSGMTRLDLAKDFASWTPDAKLADGKVRTAALSVKGQIAKAYLNVKASVGGKPLTKYESVFVKLNDTGGHLFRPRSLNTPADAAATSLLYEMDSVPVLPGVPYDEKRTPQDADLLALLKDGKSVRLTAFVSSLRPALLEELSIVYVCTDGSDCSVSLK